MPASQTIKQLELDVEQRLGLVPAMYRATPDTVSALASIWSMSRACWLDNPLSTTFKQRLLVYLALLSGSRYCVGRHAAWLRGSGRLLEPGLGATSTDLLSLLQSPPPGDNEARRACELLDASPAHRAELPSPGSSLEHATFVAAACLFLGKGDPSLLRGSLAQALGGPRLEQLLLLISYFQAERQWVQSHPQLPLDDDVVALYRREPELAQMVDAILAQLEHADSQRDRFMGMLGHELRNPVAAISAVSDMFQVVGIDDERLRNASNILHRQTRSLSEMLDNLLEVSNLAFGKVTMAKVPLVPDEVLTAVLRQHDSRFAEQGVNVQRHAAERRVYVMADRTRLSKVFEEILSNARKFARSPGCLKVTTVLEGKWITIRFEDEGTGLPADKSQKTFEPHAPARVEPVSANGLGIGLTISRMVVALHDGTLEASSAGPGKGASFTLRLPLAAPDAAVKPEKKTPGRPAARMRVLAIEDNKDFAQLFRHMLEIMGCELDITADARSGLKLAHDRLPELIFCDIGLPGDMNGFDFARAVRSDERLRHIPLVAVSGYTSPEDREKALAAGFDRVCAKPVKFADINDALSVYSANRSA